MNLDIEKDAYWFPHDSNAKDDDKCLILIEELGLEGYGIFWVLVEILRNQKDFQAPLRILPALANRYNTTLEKMKAVVTRYELFQVVDDKFFFSESLKRRMAPFIESKKQSRISGIKGNLIKYGYATKKELDKMTPDEIIRLNQNKADLSGGESGGAKGPGRNNSTVNKNTGEDSTVESKIPTLAEVKDYFKENGYDPEIGEKAWNIYNASIEDHPKRKYWRDSRDNLIKNWKMKMQTVWFKDEHKLGSADFNSEIAMRRQQGQ